MIISHYILHRYRIPFVTPLRLTGRELPVREGYIARLFSSERRTACGEIAPLPGLHRESPEEAVAQLHTALNALKGTPIPGDLASFDGAFDRMPALAGLFPSVRTGVEMALLNLLSTEALEPLPDLFALPYRPSVPLNGLVSGTVGEVEERSMQLVAEGYGTLKIKVGRIEPRQEVAMVRFVRSIVGPSVALRLDANRSWTLDTAVDFGRAVAEYSIDYIEEPVADPALFPEFVHATGIPVALDESLAAGNEIPAQLDPTVVRALVLKPSVVGGIEQTVHLINLARRYSVDAVLSSAFETGVSLGMYAWLASIANDSDVACGLDTYRHLTHDILTEPFRAVGGMVDVHKAWLQSQSVRNEYVTPMPAP